MESRLDLVDSSAPATRRISLNVLMMKQSLAIVDRVVLLVEAKMISLELNVHPQCYHNNNNHHINHHNRIHFHNHHSVHHNHSNNHHNHDLLHLHHHSSSRLEAHLQHRVRPCIRKALRVP